MGYYQLLYLLGLLDYPDYLDYLDYPDYADYLDYTDYPDYLDYPDYPDILLLVDIIAFHFQFHDVHYYIEYQMVFRSATISLKTSSLQQTRHTH